MKKKLIPFFAMLAVACSFGLAACGEKGEQGNPGAAGVGIASTTINADGKLVITYTDGKVETVDMPEKKCEHEDKKVRITVKEGNCVEYGFAYDVCDECKTAYHVLLEKNANRHVVDPAVAATTEEDYSEVIETKTVAETCTVDGYTVTVCACEQEYLPSKTVIEHHHILDDEHMTITKATCMVDGSKNYTCQREGCGEVIEEKIEATGHAKEYEEYPVVNEGVSICVSGGQVMVACPYCFETTDTHAACPDCEGAIKETKLVEGNGHAITSEWEVEVAPTFTTEGELVGYCDTCKFSDAKVVLPKLGSSVYTETVNTPATCTSNGQTTYSATITNAANEDSTGKAVSFTVVTSTLHVKCSLGTEHLDTGCTGTHTDLPLDKIYAPSEVDEVFGNAPAICSDASGRGSVHCDLCDKSYLVNVKGECKEEDYIDNETNRKPATCTENGIIYYTCVCGTVHEDTTTLEKLGHAYKPTPNYTGANVTSVTFTCDNDATHTYTVNCSAYGEMPTLAEMNADNVANAGKWSETDLAHASEPATCEKAGFIYYYYDYTPEGGSLTRAYTEKQTDAQKLHNYNDKELDTAEDAPALSLTELKDIFGNALVGLDTYGNSLTDCTNAGKGSFKCSDCGKGFLINIKGDHIVDETKTTTTEADCDSNSVTHYVCKVDATHTWDVENLNTAKGHKYAYVADTAVEAAGKVKFVCSVCQDVKEVEGTKGATEDVPATCQAEGYKRIEITYTKPGESTPTTEWFTLETYAIVPGVHFYENASDDLVAIDTKVEWNIATLKGDGYFGANLTGLDFFGNEVPNCQGTVSVAFACARCPQVEKDGSMVDQKYLITVRGEHAMTTPQVVAPTCTTGGYTYSKCQTEGCNVESKTNEVAALGHIYDYDYVTEATETTTGLVKVTCTYPNCTSTFEDIVVPVIGGEGWTSTTVEATCTSTEKTTWKFVITMPNAATIGGNGTYEIKKFIEGDKKDHNDQVPPAFYKEWKEKDQAGVEHTYKGYFCNNCKQIIVTEIDGVAVAPEADAA